MSDKPKTPHLDHLVRLSAKAPLGLDGRPRRSPTEILYARNWATDIAEERVALAEWERQNGAENPAPTSTKPRFIDRLITEARAKGARTTAAQLTSALAAGQVPAQLLAEDTGGPIPKVAPATVPDAIPDMTDDQRRRRG